MKEIKRGDLYYADLRPIIGSEQGGVRPVLIIQNDVGNHFSPTGLPAAEVPQAANQADSVAEDVSTLVSDFNGLLAKLKAAGLMASS